MKDLPLASLRGLHHAGSPNPLEFRQSLVGLRGYPLGLIIITRLRQGEGLEVVMDFRVLAAKKLEHDNANRVIFRVHPKIRARGAAPAKLARIKARRGFLLRRCRILNRAAITKPRACCPAEPWQQRRRITQMIRHHQAHSFSFQNTRPVIFAFIK